MSHLILTRRVGEKIHIGDNVTLTVMSVEGSRVRIGIDAPKDVVVDREEIFMRKKREQSGEEPNGNE